MLTTRRVDRWSRILLAVVVLGGVFGAGVFVGYELRRGVPEVDATRGAQAARDGVYEAPGARAPAGKPGGIPADAEEPAATLPAVTEQDGPDGPTEARPEATPEARLEQPLDSPADNQAPAPQAVTAKPSNDEPPTADPSESGVECQVPLGDVLANGQLDLSPAGFELRGLGSGFELTNLVVGAYGICQEDGAALDPYVAVQSGWTHTTSGYQVSVEQRQSSEDAPALFEPGYVTFSDGGYQFTIGAGRRPFTSLADRISLGDLELPRTEMEALSATLSALAPQLDPACFFTPRLGTWDDVAAAGIGDPRSLIPDDWQERTFEFRTFYPPADGCASASPMPAPRIFTASFASPDGQRYVNLSAAPPTHGGGSFPASVDEYNAGWGNERYVYTVGLSPQPHDDLPGLVAFAGTLDPSFDETCSLVAGELVESDVETVGIGQPPTPDGYEQTFYSGTLEQVGDGCGLDFAYTGNASATWTFGNADGTFIDVIANSTLGANSPLSVAGTVSPSMVSWTSQSGTGYTITSFSAAPGFAGLGAAALVGLALAVDPALDPSSLVEAPPETGEVGIVSY